MHIPAKVDYGIRALLALTAAGAPQTAEYLAGEQGLPPRFLGAILADLRRAGIVASQRGAEGGYRLARDSSEITIADVIRALDGPLAEVRGYRPELTIYDGAAENLQQVWVAVRASLRSVLEKVTLADVIAGDAARPREADDGRPRRLGGPLTIVAPAPGWRPGVVPLTLVNGATRAGSMPNSRDGALRPPTASSWPARASSLSTATTRCAASTSKCCRRAARASERPKPSVPSEV